MHTNLIYIQFALLILEKERIYLQNYTILEKDLKISLIKTSDNNWKSVYEISTLQKSHKHSAQISWVFIKLSLFRKKRIEWDPLAFSLLLLWLPRGLCFALFGKALSVIRSRFSTVLPNKAFFLFISAFSTLQSFLWLLCTKFYAERIFVSLKNNFYQ